jgi:hypothetical protein
MPCQSEPESAAEITAPLKRRLKALQERLDEITRHLCFICGTLEKAGVLSKYASDLMLRWWDHHQAWDNQRVRPKMKSYIEARLESFPGMTPGSVAEYFIAEAEKIHPVSDFHRGWFLEMASEILEAVRVERETEKYKKKSLKESALAKLTRKEREILGLE